MKTGRLCCGFLVIVGLLFSALPGWGCDDTVLNLITSRDPNNEFCAKLAKLHENIAGLGTVLSNRQEPLYEPILEQLMQSWIEFSGKYSVNPPRLAVPGPDWEQKLDVIGTGIGTIRAMIQKKEIQMAHDRVLGLSEDLIGLFETVRLAGLRPVFQRGAEILAEIPVLRMKADKTGIGTRVASFSALIATFPAYLDSGTRKIFDRIGTSVQGLPGLLAKTADPELLELNASIQVLTKDFQTLRAEILTREWFPPAATASPTQDAGEKP